MSFESESLAVIALAFFLVAIVPVKLAASVFGAQNNSWGSAVLAIVVSIPAGYLGLVFLGLGIFGAYLGVALAVATVLRASFLGSLFIPLLAVVILFGVVQGLSSLGVLGFSATAI